MSFPNHCRHLVTATHVCGEAANKYVTVPTAAGKASVPMCQEHYAENRRSAAARRVKAKT